VEKIQSFTAFDGDRLLSSGIASTVALAIKSALQADGGKTILTFDDETGQQTDFDLRGSNQEIVARLAVPAVSPADLKRPGRPKLGVVAREVTLLPRHWEWLIEQPGGASVTLRKLVDAARASSDDLVAIRRAQQASDRVMSAMLGNQPNYEEAARALYASNRKLFVELTEQWPNDLRDYVRRIALPAFSKAAK
jgi:hypothetical protein